MCLGNIIRLLRIRRGLRQIDLARLAGVSQSTISRIERGHFTALSLDTVRRVAAVLDCRIDLTPRWRGGDLDRLVNAHHSQLHEQVARRFAGSRGWMVAPEVSFAIRGERGVVDILALNRERDAILVIELKTEIVDVNEMLGTLDRKRRLAVQIAAERGWAVTPVTRVSVWLIVADSRTNRRRVAAHTAVLRSALPTDGRTMPGWLVRPLEPVQTLSFWTDMRPGNARTDLTTVRRVRRRVPCTKRSHEPGPSPSSGPKSPGANVWQRRGPGPPS